MRLTRKQRVNGILILIGAVLLVMLISWCSHVDDEVYTTDIVETYNEPSAPYVYIESSMKEVQRAREAAEKAGAQEMPLLLDRAQGENSSYVATCQVVQKYVDDAKRLSTAAADDVNTWRQNTHKLTYNYGDELAREQLENEKQRLINEYIREYIKKAEQFTVYKNLAQKKSDDYGAILAARINECKEAEKKEGILPRSINANSSVKELHKYADYRYKQLQHKYNSVIVPKHETWPLDDSDCAEVQNVFTVCDGLYRKRMNLVNSFSKRLVEEREMLEAWLNSSEKRPDVIALKDVGDGGFITGDSELRQILNEHIKVMENAAPKAPPVPKFFVVTTESRFKTLVEPLIKDWLKRDNKTGLVQRTPDGAGYDFFVDEQIPVRVLINEECEERATEIAENQVNTIAFGSVKLTDNGKVNPPQKVRVTSLCRDALVFYTKDANRPMLPLESVWKNNDSGQNPREVKLYFFEPGSAARKISDLCGFVPMATDIVGDTGEITVAATSVDKDVLMLGALHQQSDFIVNGCTAATIQLNQTQRAVNPVKDSTCIFNVDYPGDFVQEIQVHYQQEAVGDEQRRFITYLTSDQATCADTIRNCNYVPVIRSVNDLIQPLISLRAQHIDIDAVLDAMNAVAKKAGEGSAYRAFKYQAGADCLFGKDMGYTMLFSTGAADSSADDIVRPGDDRAVYLYNLGAAIKRLLNEHKKIAIVVVGHTDVRDSSKESHKSLSQKRAVNYVKKVLSHEDLMPLSDRNKLLGKSVVVKDDNRACLYVNSDKSVYLLTIGSGKDFHTITPQMADATGNRAETRERVNQFYAPDRRAQLFIIVPNE